MKIKNESLVDIQSRRTLILMSTALLVVGVITGYLLKVNYKFLT